jgi:hypothetical protein
MISLIEGVEREDGTGICEEDGKQARIGGGDRTFGAVMRDSREWKGGIIEQNSRCSIIPVLVWLY